jgi:tetratricopeptide (TPR) repeat protein
MTVLRALAEHLDQVPAVDKPDPAKGARRLIPKDQKKFRKLKDAGEADRAGGNLAEQEQEEQPEEAAEDTPRPVAAVGGEAPAPRQDGRPVRPSPAPGRIRGAAKWNPAQLTGSVFFQLSILCLMALSFYLGRVSPHPAAAVSAAAPAGPLKPMPSPEAAASPTARVLELIDQAMAAEKAGDFAKAFALCNSIEREAPNTNGILMHLTQLAIENGDPAMALKTARSAIDQGDSVPMSYVLLGQLVQRRSGASESLQDFEQAALADPFEAKYFYYWGEALRRAGHPQEAAQRLREAIDRLREPALEGLYRLKLRLTQIEMGQEADFAAEMAQGLATNPPSPQWLLTASAVAMWHNQPAAAAKYLDEASQRTDSAALHNLLRDYFFFNYADNPLLARFFTGVAPNLHPAPGAPAGMTLAPSAPSAETPSNALDLAPMPPAIPPASPLDSRN